MKPIKPFLIVLAVAFFGTIGQLMAQETAKKERTPEEIAQMQTKKLTKELLLTDGQQKAAYDINLKYVQQNAELRKSLRKAKQEFGKRDDELKSILDDGQKTKLDSLRAAQREKIKQARQERKAAAEPAE